MEQEQGCLIDVGQLRIGMYVHLDLGWTEHPFPLNSFKIRSRQQIDVIHSLGLERIRYSPDRSDPQVSPAPPPDRDEPNRAPAEPPPAPRLQRREICAAAQASLEMCERKFARAATAYRRIQKIAEQEAAAARSEAETVVNGMLDEILMDQEITIRLLSEQAAEEISQHAINVAIVSLLLGRALEVPDKAIFNLGMGALLHDIGKSRLPDRLRWSDQVTLPADQALFQQHVAHGVVLAQGMELPQEILQIIAQHHEAEDGSGYPAGTRGGNQSVASKIVAVVNRYDNLCNPGNPAQAVTPHEALSTMFTTMRSRLDQKVMTTFIRMMGVYPPGSVVQLTDGRYGLVVSVDPFRPLKPTVLIHEPSVRKSDALPVGLEAEPDLGIQRSLKPLQLPRLAFDYLCPRKRMCYFFERARLALPRGREQ